MVFKMADIFISYAREDLKRVEVLAALLKKFGWSVWWDRSIPAGKTFAKVIEEALEDAKCVIVIWSKESTNSSWVAAEASDGHKRGILIPILFENTKLPLLYRELETIDMTTWFGNEEDLSL